MLLPIRVFLSWLHKRQTPLPKAAPGRQLRPKADPGGQLLPGQYTNAVWGRNTLHCRATSNTHIWVRLAVVSVVDRIEQVKLLRQQQTVCSSMTTPTEQEDTHMTWRTTPTGQRRPLLLQEGSKCLKQHSTGCNVPSAGRLHMRGCMPAARLARSRHPARQPSRHPSTKTPPKTPPPCPNNTHLELHWLPPPPPGRKQYHCRSRPLTPPRVPNPQKTTPTYAALCRVALQVCVQCVQRCVDCAYCCTAVDADAEVRVQPQQLLHMWADNMVALDEPAQQQS
jgi:hypothetical protein